MNVNHLISPILHKGNFFKNMKLKRQLSIMIAIFLSFTLFIQVLYSTRFFYILEHNAKDNTTNLLKQVGQNIDTFSDSLIQISNTISSSTYVHKYLTSTNQIERAELMPYLKDMFTYICFSNSAILDIAIIDKQNRIYGNQTMPFHSTWSTLLEQYTYYQLDPDTTPLFELIKSPNGLSYYTYSMPIHYQDNLSYKIGYCVILFNGSSIQHLLNDLRLTDDSSVFLVNLEGKILACHDYTKIGSYLGKDISTACTNDVELFNFSYGGKQYFIQQLKLSKTNWRLVSLIPSTETRKQVMPLLWFGIIFCILSFTILAYIACLIFHNITASVNGLSLQMKEIGQNNIHERISIDCNNEIGEISVEVNKMLEQIDALTRNIFDTQTSLYEMELLKKEAEFLALQNQINPHFLYNTLECIRDIALVYQANEISSIAISITKIFRYCIKTGTVVTIAQEMTCINDYINIIQIRYQDRFTIEKHIEESLLSLKMMKFLLQPIIENAIFHGLELKAGPGLLRITGNLKEDGSIFFQIVDNGAGIPMDTLTKLQEGLTNNLYVDSNTSHTGIGLLNIHNRIKTMYGPQYGLSIESSLGKGTCVTLHFPQYDDSI